METHDKRRWDKGRWDKGEGGLMEWDKRTRKGRTSLRTEERREVLGSKDKRREDKRMGDKVRGRKRGGDE